MIYLHFCIFIHKLTISICRKNLSKIGMKSIPDTQYRLFSLVQGLHNHHSKCLFYLPKSLHLYPRHKIHTDLKKPLYYQIQMFHCTSFYIFLYMCTPQLPEQ